MNCFQHPTETAVVFCKECGKPLCADCSRMSVLGETRICSEVCAKLFQLRPTPDDETAGGTPFQKIYASVFIVLLFGILSGTFTMWAAQTAINNEERIRHGQHVSRHDEKNDAVIFYYLGITGRRTQFAIGAGLGISWGLLYVKKNIASRKNSPSV